MPYSLEVNDVITYGALSMSPDRYTDILIAQFDQLLEESEESGLVMCIPLHAYLVSQPHRIRAFERMLQHVAAHQDDVWCTTATEIAQWFREHYWAQTLNDIEKRGLTRPGIGFDIDCLLYTSDAADE